MQLYYNELTNYHSSSSGFNQGSQYHTGGYTSLTNGTIYFGYRSIPVHCFGFTAIFYIYKYIYIYIYTCVCVCIIINIKVCNKTFPQFRTNYSWFWTLVSIKRKRKKHNIKNRKFKSYYCILRKQIILIN